MKLYHSWCDIYNQIFIELFSQEKQRINAHINNLKIEHVGNTAISELGGKGIIDILVSVDKKEMSSISKKLEELGYEFRPTSSTGTRFFHRIDLPDAIDGTRRYHLHLTYTESKDWQEVLAFRDYLLSHLEAVQEYTLIKKQAVDAVNEDGEKYRKLKEPFIQKVLKKALATI